MRPRLTRRRTKVGKGEHHPCCDALGWLAVGGRRAGAGLPEPINTLHMHPARSYMHPARPCPCPQALPRLRSACARRAAAPPVRCATCASERTQPSTCSTWTSTLVGAGAQSGRLLPGIGRAALGPPVNGRPCPRCSRAASRPRQRPFRLQLSLPSAALLCSLLRPQVAVDARGPQPREGPLPEDLLRRQLCAAERRGARGCAGVADAEAWRRGLPMSRACPLTNRTWGQEVRPPRAACPACPEPNMHSCVPLQVGGFKDLNVFAITTHERGQDVHMQARPGATPLLRWFGGMPWLARGWAGVGMRPCLHPIFAAASADPARRHPPKQSRPSSHAPARAPNPHQSSTPGVFPYCRPCPARLSWPSSSSSSARRRWRGRRPKTFWPSEFKS